MYNDDITHLLEKVEKLEDVLAIRKGTITIQQEIIETQTRALFDLNKRIEKLEKISRATVMELIEEDRCDNDN